MEHRFTAVNQVSVKYQKGTILPMVLHGYIVKGKHCKYGSKSVVNFQNEQKLLKKWAKNGRFFNKKTGDMRQKANLDGHFS